MSKLKKILFNAIPIVTLCAALVYAMLSDRPPEETRSVKMDEAFFRITNIDVGDGDAALLQQGDEYVLIDAGLKKAYPVISDYLNAKGIKTLKFVMFTHFDKDHIGDAARLFDDYAVETVFIPDYVSEKKSYSVLMQSLENHGDVRVVNEVTEYLWKDIKVEIIPALDKAAMEQTGSNYDNNMSLVSMFTYGRNRMLFAGDIEKARIKELVNSGVDLSCDYLKMPHHGRYNKALKDLLKSSTPEYAVISQSADEGIERKTTILLDTNRIKCLDTAKGNVITICDGVHVDSMYESQFVED